MNNTKRNARQGLDRVRNVAIIYLVLKEKKSQQARIAKLSVFKRISPATASAHVFLQPRRMGI